MSGRPVSNILSVDSSHTIGGLPPLASMQIDIGEPDKQCTQGVCVVLRTHAYRLMCLCSDEHACKHQVIIRTCR